MSEQQPRMYRLYFVNRLQRVQEWQALCLPSDEAAMAQAALLVEGHIAVEVVEAIRIVGTILANDVGVALHGNQDPGLCW